MKTELRFINEETKQSFLSLSKSEKQEDLRLFKKLTHVFERLKSNSFCGIQIPKKQIPDYYTKLFGQLPNLWKYNLSGSMRLIYFISSNEDEVMSVIVEWMNHHEYENRFGYH